MLHAMYFETVGLQRAPLSKTFLAKIAFVRPNPRVRSRVPLQIESVVETFPAKRAKVPFDI